MLFESHSKISNDINEISILTTQYARVHMVCKNSSATFRQLNLTRYSG